MTLFSEEHWKAHGDLSISRLIRKVMIGYLSVFLSLRGSAKILSLLISFTAFRQWIYYLLNQGVSSWRDSSAFYSVTAAVAVAVILGKGNLFTSLDSEPAQLRRKETCDANGNLFLNFSLHFTEIATASIYWISIFCQIVLNVSMHYLD